jgi:hypothetical protein
MLTPKRIHIVMIMAASALTACVVRPNEPEAARYNSTLPATEQSDVVALPVASHPHYRGTISNTAPMTNDASINANVISAIQASSGGATNLQVTTLNGVITLRGTADTQAVAQNDVQAARQVRGVQRVDYDIEVLGR